MKCLVSENVILQTLARCFYDNIGTLCDVYKFTVKDLIDSPTHYLQELIWEFHVHVFCDCIVACVYMCNY